MMEEVACKHRWLIESPNGTWSRGVCRHCGAERENFCNVVESDLDLNWKQRSIVSKKRRWQKA